MIFLPNLWYDNYTLQTTVFKPVEPKFKCTCGAGFDFEDDYQVHQVYIQVIKLTTLNFMYNYNGDYTTLHGVSCIHNSVSLNIIILLTFQ